MINWNRLKSRYSRAAANDVEPLPRGAVANADAIVTHNEVSDRHGTGVILSRIFGAEPNILSIRSTHLYDEHILGARRLMFGHEGLARQQSFERVLYALNRGTVRRVICVPYRSDELLTALVLKEVFGAPLCTWLMDDNNIFSRGIPDELMREVLAKSDLRLAISPELRDAYEQKYELKFWVVPPIVNEGALNTSPRQPATEALQNRRGVLIGSLWSSAWLDKLRQAFRGSGFQLDWFGNAKAHWLKDSTKNLHEDGITDCGFLPEHELTGRLQQYALAVVPSGTLDQDDDRPEIARLSLPTRLPFLLAAANMPTLVLGHPNTAAARFVERFGFGRVARYEPEEIRQTISSLCVPEVQLQLRSRAAAQASLFSAKDLAPWLWRSLELGEPADDRFEKAFTRHHREIAPYLEGPAPRGLSGDFVLLFQALRRLKGRGFAPDFVLDVGSSSGVWSEVAARVFPKARFILVDPLYQKYRQLNDWYFRTHPEFECVEVALSDRSGEAELRVSPDLYGSSLLQPVDFRVYEPIKVQVRTLDEVARDKKLLGHGLLKIDVQFTEHLVLAGAKQFLSQVDVLLLELSLVRSATDSLLFHEMCELTRNLGFRYYEDVGGWRSPADGSELQKDVVFVRGDLFLAPGFGPESIDLKAAERNARNVESPSAGPRPTAENILPA